MKNTELRLELSTCEEIVMNILWDAGKTPMTCSDIMQQLHSRYEMDYKDTTVYTFLNVLIKKGFAYMIRDKKNYYYACSEREDYLQRKFNTITRIWFDGNKDKLREFLDN